tara:strand:- start:415 stop:1620 length:1206 start_codon:yes stop_codon:yes gene_type:complete
MKFKRIILFNQVVGQLFYELSLALSNEHELGGLLIYGDIIERNKNLESKVKLGCNKLNSYNRNSNFSKISSWVKFTIESTKYILNSKSDDLLLISSNPPILILYLYLLTSIKNISFFVLIYDIYPNVLVEKKFIGAENIFIKLTKFVYSKVYHKALKIITISDNMAKVIKNDFQLEKNNLRVIKPWVNCSKIKPIKKSINPYFNNFIKNKNSFVVLYAGNMGISHDMESILEAANILKNKNDIEFLLIGGGIKYSYAKSFVIKNNLKNVHIFPYQPAEIFPYILSLADASLVSIEDGMENLILPSKTFYYLAAGSAIIGITNSPSDLGELIESSNVGFIVKPNNSAQIAKVIMKMKKRPLLLENMKLNSRNLSEDSYSLEKGIQNFKNILFEINSKLIILK